jgi:hypothetical protein
MPYEVEPLSRRERYQIRWDDEALPDAYRAWARPTGIVQTYGWPLVLEGDLIGALSLSYANHKSLSSDEDRRFRYLADQAALAVVNARTFEHERSLREALEKALVAYDSISVGTVGEVKSMLMRLVDFLKSKQITAIFTSLSHSNGATIVEETDIVPDRGTTTFQFPDWTPDDVDLVWSPNGHEVTISRGTDHVTVRGPRRLSVISYDPLVVTDDTHVIGITGPPGAGKGTQAALIAPELGLKHLATGDLFPDLMASGRAVAGETSGRAVPADFLRRFRAVAGDVEFYRKRCAGARSIRPFCVINGRWST